MYRFISNGEDKNKFLQALKMAWMIFWRIALWVIVARTGANLATIAWVSLGIGFFCAYILRFSVSIFPLAKLCLFPYSGADVFYDLRKNAPNWASKRPTLRDSSDGYADDELP